MPAKKGGGAVRRTASQSSPRNLPASSNAISTSNDICKGFCDNNICNKLVFKNSAESIGCKLCNQWYHVKCAEVSEAANQAISTHKLVWLCKDCQERIPALRKLLASDEAAHEKHLEKLSAKIEKLQGEVTENA